MDMGCFFEAKPCAPGLNGSDRVEHITPCKHGVGWHHSGDIWLAAYSEAEHSILIRDSEQPIAGCPSYLTNFLLPKNHIWCSFIYRMPTHFDLLHGSDNVCHFIAQNDHLIVHLAVFQHAEFLSQTYAASQCKAHSSLAIYFMDAQTMNNGITHHIAYQGQLLPTVKFIC